MHYNGHDFSVWPKSTWVHCERSVRDPAIYMSLETWVQQGYNMILRTDEHPPRDSALVWDWDVLRKNYTAGLTSFS